MQKTGAHGWTTRTMLALFSLSILGCGGGAPTAAEDPVDPAGTWIFTILNTATSGICSDELLDMSEHEITKTKTGAGPPYNVTAIGFLGVATNVLTGTFDENNRLLISGSYPEEATGTTMATHDLIATSENRMEGTETWTFTTDPDIGSCVNNQSSVTANRIS